MLIIFLIFCFISYNTLENKVKNKVSIINYDKKYKIFEKNPKYKEENKERYIKYYEKNQNLDYNEVIIKVNIGLDKDFYSYVKNTDLRKNYSIIVNKYNKLNENYVPLDLENINNKNFISNTKYNMLRKEACYWFEKLSNDSIKNNTPVYGQSAFRSYDRQKELYNYYLKEYGENKTNIMSAKPGFSEHQTGLAIDVSSTKNGNMETFGETKSFEWMQNNAHKYGFILRYPKEKSNIHGYSYEPWHYRFVGIKIATEIYKNYSNLTYDEFYYLKID